MGTNLELSKICKRIVDIHNLEAIEYNLRRHYRYDKYLLPVIQKYLSDDTNPKIKFNTMSCMYIKDAIYLSNKTDITYKDIFVDVKNVVTSIELDYVNGIEKFKESACGLVIMDKLYDFIVKDLLPAMFTMYRVALLDTLSSKYRYSCKNLKSIKFVPHINNLHDLIYSNMLTTFYNNVEEWHMSYSGFTSTSIDYAKLLTNSYNMRFMLDIIYKVCSKNYEYKGSIEDLVKELMIININPSFIFNNMVVDLTVDDGKTYYSYAIHNNINIATTLYQYTLATNIYECYAMDLLDMKRYAPYCYLTRDTSTTDDDWNESNNRTNYGNKIYNYINSIITQDHNVVVDDTILNKDTSSIITAHLFPDGKTDDFVNVHLKNIAACMTNLKHKNNHDILKRKDIRLQYTIKYSPDIVNDQRTRDLLYVVYNESRSSVDQSPIKVHVLRDIVVDVLSLTLQQIISLQSLVINRYPLEKIYDIIDDMCRALYFVETSTYVYFNEDEESNSWTTPSFKETSDKAYDFFRLTNTGNFKMIMKCDPNTKAVKAFMVNRTTGATLPVDDTFFKVSTSTKLSPALKFARNITKSTSYFISNSRYKKHLTDNIKSIIKELITNVYNLVPKIDDYIVTNSTLLEQIDNDRFNRLPFDKKLVELEYYDVNNDKIFVSDKLYTIRC